MTGRVVQLTPVLASTGGIETCVRELSGDLVADGVQTLVLVPGPEHRPQKTQGDWTVIDMPFSDVGAVLKRVKEFDPGLVVVHHLGNAAVTNAIQSAFQTMEVVHTFLCPGGKLFRREDNLCHHPLAPRCLVDWYLGPCGPSPSPLTAVRGLLYSRSYIRALRHLDYVVVGSSYMRDYLTDEGIAAERITVARLQSQMPSSNRVSRRTVAAAAAAARHKLLFVGRITYNKGLQYLLRALTHLEDSFSLDVAGEGWFLPTAEQLARNLGVADRVTFLGSVRGASLTSLYRQAHLVIVPSICPEPVGLVVGEARRQRTPVVVSRAGGLPEWADNDPGVTIAPRADADGLAQAIRQALRQSTKDVVGIDGTPPYLGDTVLDILRKSQPS